MKIGILQCGHALEAAQKTHGNFAAMFERLLVGQGFEFASWDVVDMAFPADVSEADGWLLSGSRHGVYEEHAFIPPLTAFIQKAYAQSVPMVGVCFGHQMIAQALGGRVEKFSGGWSIGAREYETTDGDTLHLNAWHQDQVVELPPEAAVFAANDFCKYAGLVYGHKALSIQPHPEFTNAIVADYARLRYASGDYPPEMLEKAQANTLGVSDSAVFAQRIGDFFRAS